jgi:SAM-dependent methyltransferase
MGTWEAPEPDLHRFYTSRYVEDQRLRRSPHGRLEFARTQELLRRALPPVGARVLDVGGGTGIHAQWLAEDGFAVELVDLVPEHVAQAGRLPGVTATVGDARALEVPSDRFDAVLLLGPLYHLTDAADRALALAEAGRVARPGGLIAAAAISRHAGLLDLGAHGLLDDFSLPLVRETMETGLHDPRLAFTTAYFHTAQELADELAAAGLRDVDVLGVEGPAGPALDAHGIERIEEFLPSAIEAARVVERDPAVIAASAHLLAFGRVPGLVAAPAHRRAG